MISITQWRLRIGAFARGKTSVCANVRTTFTITTSRTTLTTSRSGYAIVNGLLLFSYAFIIAKLLLCSGDIECNPGPTNCKKCPNCLNDTLPIKLKICTCGYAFHKKSHRQPPKCYSIPIATSQLVTSQVVTDQVPTSVTDNDPLPSSVQSQPNTVTITSVTDNDPLPSNVQSQPTVSKSVKWDKYKTTINERRKQKYRKYCMFVK